MILQDRFKELVRFSFEREAKLMMAIHCCLILLLIAVALFHWLSVLLQP